MHTVNKIETFHPAYRRRYGPSRVLLILCLLCATNTVLTRAGLAGTTYYVDAQGTSGGSGTSDDPYHRQGNEILNLGQPGDVVSLQDGYYGEIDTSARSNSDYITIQAQPGHTPTFKRIKLSSGSKWIFRGLTISPEFAPVFERWGDGIIKIHNSQDIIIENNNIFSVQDASSWTASDWNSLASRGIHTQSSPNVIIRNNTISNIQFGVAMLWGHGTLIEYNTIEHNIGDGIQVYSSSDVTVQYNILKNFYNVNNNHDDGIQFYTLGDDPPCDNVILRGNIIIHQDPGITKFPGDMHGIGFFDGPYDNLLVENNVVIIKHLHGIGIYGATNSVIINNIAFHPTPTYPAGVYIHTGFGTSSNTVIRNNMANVINTAGTNITADHNIDIGDDYAPDVLFVDYLNNDLRHKSGSPAIDTGSADLAPDIDIIGTSRPQGAGYDIGAYEYMSGPPDTTPPSLVSVNASENSVDILFNEALEQSSAEDINNYTISNGISITSASLSVDLMTVTLTTSTHTEGITYILTVSDVRDLAGNPMPQTTVQYQYTQLDINAGLVGYWKFDEGSGTSATDSSGNGNTATLINGPVWTVQGELGFDGIDDAVEIGTADLNISSGTITLWAYAESFSGSHHFLFGHMTQPWSNRIQLYTDDVEGYLDLGLGDSHVRHANIENLDTHTWYHIALSWDGSNYIVYINGVAEAAGAYTGLSTLETYADIGNNGNSSDRTESFNGIIDEVRVYNRALTADEVSNLALVFLPIDDKEVEEGSTLTFEVRTQDPNQEVFIESHSLPSEPNFFSNTNIFTWTPTYGDVGSYEVTFEAPHGEFVDFETITITVHKPTRPVYRFWSSTNSRHFYTIKETEKDKLINIYAHVWTYESIAYYAFETDREPGLVPVYRFWSPVLIAHFYTTSESEKQKLIDRYSHVWTYEGIAFYAYPEGQQPVDTLPVYRFWSGTLETHFYTMNETEKNKLIDNYSHVWTYEGIAWYAYTSY